MSYTNKVTVQGSVNFDGFRELQLDLDVSGTAAGGTSISLDLDVSAWAPTNGTTYRTPQQVLWTVRDEPICGMENLEIHWDKDNDDTTNGYVRIQIDDNGVAANGLANLEVRFHVRYQEISRGGVG